MIAALTAFVTFWRGVRAAPAPTRVGLLNTGELVLLDGSDRAQVLSVSTAQLLRDVLDADPQATTASLRPGPGDAGYGCTCGIFDHPVDAVIQGARG